jgi:hypothetical protein
VCSRSGPAKKSLARQEHRGFAEEEFELVVVDPVACAGDGDEAAVRDGLEAWVGFGDGQKALLTPEEQGGARDLAEDFHGVFDVVAVGWKDAGEIVELPEE